MRRQGIYSESLPTIKSKTVSASDFLIGGIVGFFERKYLIPFLCNTPNDFKTIFGDNINPAWFGNDAVKGYFDNIVGSSGKLYVKSHVGFGTAIDAVVATLSPVDQAGSPLATLKLESAYQSNKDYGISGNRTGFKIANGARFTTSLTTTTTALDVSIVLDSVAGIRVGDMIKINHTSPVYRKIVTISQSTNTVTFSGAIGAIVSSAVAVTVLGFQLKTFRKTLSGVETEVATDLGKVWCTMEPEVSDFYVENVHSRNPWLMSTDLSSASPLNTSFPAEVSVTTYLASGADGTAPTTVAHWAADLTAFDNTPVRFIANPETTDVSIQKAMEIYCKGRDDNPKVIFNIAEDRTKAQLITIGNNYQRADDVLGVIVANWLTIQDPFSTSALSPDREIPNVGHVMGAWVRSIGTLGVHYIPAVNQISILGITGLIGNTFMNDLDRTDLCNASINVIQAVRGVGFSIKSFFTPSTTTEFMFANGILMREFYKVSIKDSLADSVNEPNNFARIVGSRDAVLAFFLRQWFVGSTGHVPAGETFGQSLNPDGTATAFEDHVQVQADLFNNPQSEINLGQRNIDSWFTYPAPTGSIKIGVGLILR